jgi:hypothetical protein
VRSSSESSGKEEEVSVGLELGELVAAAVCGSMVVWFGLGCRKGGGETWKERERVGGQCKKGR